MASERAIPSLDRLDLQILSALQENNQASAQTLSGQIALSPSAILRRIQQYRESGVIAADVSVLEPGALGQWISVFFLVKLERGGQPAAAGAFRAELGRAAEVQLCLEISGAFDLAVLAVFPTLEAFNSFTDVHLGHRPDIRRFEVILVKRRLKFSTALPIAAIPTE